MKSIYHYETIGVYCYTVMPFGLKNAGATYQHAMSMILCDHLQKMVECYIDDIVAKNHKKGNHLNDIRMPLDIMQAYQQKMNLTKSFLRVSADKLLGFIIMSKGIHLSPDKVKAIQNMQSPKTLKELKGLQAKLDYIWRFIANVLGRCQFFMTLMRKGISFV